MSHTGSCGLLRTEYRKVQKVESNERKQITEWEEPGIVSQKLFILSHTDPAPQSDSVMLCPAHCHSNRKQTQPWTEIIAQINLSPLSSFLRYQSQQEKTQVPRMIISPCLAEKYILPFFFLSCDKDTGRTDEPLKTIILPGSSCNSPEVAASADIT